MQFSSGFARYNEYRRVLFLLMPMFAWAASVHAASGVVGGPFTLKKGVSDAYALSPECGELFVEVAGSFSGSKACAGVGDDRWGIVFSGSEDGIDRRVSLRWGNDDLGSAFDRRFMRISVDEREPDGAWLETTVADVYDDVELYGGENCLSVRFSYGEMEVWAGGGQMVFGCRVAAECKPSLCTVFTTSKLKVGYVAVRGKADPALSLQTDWDERLLNEYFSAADELEGPEGVWNYFDRDNDPLWAVPGGTYRLAVVRNDGNAGDGETGIGYDIIYISGAETRASRWRCGMLKGRLRPTRFEGNYDLEWYDSEMVDMGRECYAELTGSELLTFRFPLFRSSMRFAREK